MSSRADVLRFLSRWPRYADLERYLRVGNLTFAEEVARGLTENDPGDPPALTALAGLAARRGDWPAARGCLDRALASAPTHALTQLARALVRAAEGERAEAVDELQRLERRPRVQSLARFWRYQVERGTAELDLAAAWSAFSGLQDEEGRREIWEELSRRFPHNPEVLYTRALRPGGDLTDEQRMELLAPALRDAPDHVPVRVAAATLLRQRGETMSALIIVASVPPPIRRDPLLLATRGQILEQRGEREEALATYRSLFQETLALLPASALETAGLALTRLDRGEAARRLLEDAAEARPGDPLCPRLLARLDERLTGRDAAEHRLRRAVRECGPAPALQYALGDLLRRSGRRVEAEGLFKVLARRHPHSPWGHRGLGDLCVAERPAEALAHYARAREADAWLPLAGYDYLRGVAALRAGAPHEAQGWFLRSVAAESDNPRAWCDLGAACFHAGDLRGAMAATEHALSLAPDHPGFVHNLAVYHGKQFREDPVRNWRSGWLAWRLERRAGRQATPGWKKELWSGPPEPDHLASSSGEDDPQGGSPP